MKYAIIYEINNRKYIQGFTNTEIELNCISGEFGIRKIYSVELKEIDTLFIPIRGINTDVYFTK